MGTSLSPANSIDDAASASAVIIKAAKKELKRQESNSMKIKHLTKALLAKLESNESIPSCKTTVKKYIEESDMFDVNGKVVTLTKKSSSSSSNSSKKRKLIEMVEKQDTSEDSNGSTDKKAAKKAAKKAKKEKKKEEKKKSSSSSSSSSNNNTSADSSNSDIISAWRTTNKIVLKDARNELQDGSVGLSILASVSRENHAVGGGGGDNDSGLVERPLKRLKVSSSLFVEGSVSENQTTSIALPPECWALVMDHLDYQSVISCAATSKTILHDALPLVKSLHIDNASEMNILLAKRFRDVQNINIFSLLKEKSVLVFDAYDDDEVGQLKFLSVQYDALLQMISFLSQFHNLERVFLGGRKRNGEIVSFCQVGDYSDEDKDPDKVRFLIDLWRAAKQSEGDGIALPFSSVYAGPHFGCNVCERACRSFPLNQVINFDNIGSSEIDGYDFGRKKMHCMDVCLSRSKIEEIIEERPGGKALLQSNARLLYLLSRGSLVEIRSDDRVPLYIVWYDDKQKRELKRVIERSNLDVKKLSRKDVIQAIWRSCATDEQSALPPEEQCYFSRSSITYLMDDLGLPINRLDFGLKAANMKNLPQIVKGIMSSGGIRSICTNLLSLAMTAKEGEAQNIINLGVVPKLVDFLTDNRTGSTKSKSAMLVLSKIASKGSIDNAQVLVDAGIVPKLCLLMNSSDAKTFKSLMDTLRFLAQKNAAIRNAVLQGGALTSLLKHAKKCYNLGLVYSKAPYSKLMTFQQFLANTETLELLLSGDPSPNLDEVPINMDILSQLLSAGQAGDENMLRYACTVLSYICRTQNSMHHNAIIETGLFPCLLRLSSNLSPEVQVLVLPTIRSLVRQNDSLIAAAIDRNEFISFIACMHSPVEEVRTEACEVIRCLLNGADEEVAICVAQGCARVLCGVLNMSQNSVLIINALLGLMKILKRRVSDANPTGINIPDSEMKYMKDKLLEFQSELAVRGDQWKEMKSLVDVVKDETEDKSETGQVQNVLDIILLPLV